MRGDTSERVAEADLTASAAPTIVSRAERAATLVDVQRLVAELRALGGVREAALETVSAVTPGSVAAEAVAPGLVLVPIGLPSWRLALRVRARDATAHEEIRPAVGAIVAAAERCLSRPCRARPAEQWAAADPLAHRLLAGDRAAVVVIDPAVGWGALSEAFEMLLGYDRHAPPDMAALDLVHPDDHALAIGSFVDACAGQAVGGPFDLRVRATNGRWRTLEVVVRGFVGEPGVNAVAYLGLDVTAQRADERELRAELDRLRAGAPVEVPTSDGSFVATVAHELRGPLSSVVAFAHLLGDASSGLLDEDQRQYLDVIDRNANRLLRLIEDLLLLSRLEARHAAVADRRRSGCRTLVEPAVTEREPRRRLRRAARSPGECVDGPELMCDESADPPGDRQSAHNALKFTPAGGGSGHRRARPGDRLAVRRSADTGHRYPGRRASPSVQRVLPGLERRGPAGPAGTARHWARADGQPGHRRTARRRDPGRQYRGRRHHGDGVAADPHRRSTVSGRHTSTNDGGRGR